ncbi:hypothetical protein P3T76_012826 [Phytophthora citrophthora]|uniref:Uncharacterized protein n=1 Tax=Phytophthora citrophthora TaxID=4793 RepID=A0AAD9G4U5_9STRA|nr:hypothetical protein P3T76_012826 [Phytophthora citrophthora]
MENLEIIQHERDQFSLDCRIMTAECDRAIADRDQAYTDRDAARTTQEIADRELVTLREQNPSLQQAHRELHADYTEAEQHLHNAENSTAQLSTWISDRRVAQAAKRTRSASVSPAVPPSACKRPARSQSVPVNRGLPAGGATGSGQPTASATPATSSGGGDPDSRAAGSLALLAAQASGQTGEQRTDTDRAHGQTDPQGSGQPSGGPPIEEEEESDDDPNRLFELPSGCEESPDNSSGTSPDAVSEHSSGEGGSEDDDVMRAARQRSISSARRESGQVPQVRSSTPGGSRGHSGQDLRRDLIPPLPGHTTVLRRRHRRRAAPRPPGSDHPCSRLAISSRATIGYVTSLQPTSSPGTRG